MAAVLTDIADAVVAELEAATFDLTPVVSRVYVPTYDTSRTTDLKVFVLTTGQTVEQTSRVVADHTYAIKVAIYKACDPSDTEAVDGLVNFVQQVIDLLRSKNTLTDYADASFFRIENDPVYDPQQMDQFRTFVSVLTVEFKVLR